MGIDGKIFIAAPPAAVWAALHDAQILQASLPACREVDGKAGTGFRAKFRYVVRGFPLGLAADLTLTTITEGRACRVSVDAGHRLTGRFGGVATLDLAPRRSGTRLHYDATPRAAAGLLRFAGVPVEQIARRGLGAFLRNLKTRLEQA